MTQQPDTSAPFSVRLTREERARLEHDAADMSLGSYVRWRLFDPSRPPPRQRGKMPVKDHKLLSSLLGQLGGSRIASNLNQLTRAANSGSLVLTPDLEAEMRECLLHVAEMRRLLVAALGLSDAAP